MPAACGAWPVRSTAAALASFLAIAPCHGEQLGAGAYGELQQLQIGVERGDGEAAHWSSLSEAGLSIKSDSVRITSDQTLEHALTSRGLSYDAQTLSLVRRLNPQLDDETLGLEGQELRLFSIYGAPGGARFTLTQQVDQRIKLDTVALEIDALGEHAAAELAPDARAAFTRDLARLNAYLAETPIDPQTVGEVMRYRQQLAQFSAISNPSEQQQRDVVRSTHDIVTLIRAQRAGARDGLLNASAQPSSLVQGTCVLRWALADYADYGDTPDREVFPLSRDIAVNLDDLVVWLETADGRRLSDAAPVGVPEAQVIAQRPVIVPLPISRACR